MALNRIALSDTLRRLGRPGVIGLALVAFSVGLAVSSLWPSWQELQRLRAEAAAARHRVRATVPVIDDSPAGQLRAFYAFFPRQADASASLAPVFAAARDSGLQLARGEYAVVTDRQTGLVLFRMTLPVRGASTQIREFLAASLKAVPTLALDELAFERPTIAETEVRARVRLTLYLRLAS